jgi:alanyl-tRNA synthetase
MSGVNEIRANFLRFFAGRGHEIVPSSSLVPRNDPTLMFTNAGMVQFKNVFTGVEKRPYVRVATAQKCVRAGGKHNDLDNVGYTARHHTFFEMLGNFSFGDYFKDNAIEYAWTLLTRDFGLSKQRLTITVYYDDDDAFDLWKAISGLPDERIIRIASSDNFWAMGDTGPCGPCSEIFYDHGDHIPGGPPGSPDADGDRFIEIWNLVFMQYETLPGGERINLPRPSIDTGMGLERIAAVLQGVHDNYDIDLFRALIRASADLTGVDPDGPHRASHRVIADHLRASAFLVADGVLPSNEGRGYVLRRIMRRAMRHAQLIGARDPLMWRLVPALTREMGQAYPELLRAEALVTETLKLEETRFRTTLARGLAILEEETRPLGADAVALTPPAAPLTLSASSPTVLSGEIAFKLYDTYGFPLDLTQDALRARGLSVDVEGFNAAMERQRAEARRAWAGSGEAATETVWYVLRERIGATDFLGYETETAEGVVRAIVKDGVEVPLLETGDKGSLVLNQTPFYGEAGGQVGDVGEIAGPGFRAAVTDTRKKLGDLIVHDVSIVEGTARPGMAVELAVDHVARSATRANHSATHILHEALRLVLGDHVAQKGSLVSPDRLRFDIAHPKPITPEEIAAVEDIANRVVLENAEVTTRLMSLDDARASGARALFGEKYGDEVRVVSMGVIEDDATHERAYSIELCGGTHVSRTGDIGLISIVGESAVAAGVRRIEAKTRDEARKRLTAESRAFEQLVALLRAPPEEAGQRLEALIDDKRKLERELSEARRRLALSGGSAVTQVGGRSSGISQARAEPTVTIAGIPTDFRTVRGLDVKDLKPLADEAKARLASGVVAIANSSPDGKASLVVSVTPDYVNRISAIDLVRAGAEALGGKGGGGRPDMAQAGGPDGSKLEESLNAVSAKLAELAKS